MSQVRYLDKDIFIQQYVLKRTSHKTGRELLKEASEIWESIDTRNYNVKEEYST
jgi:hypothetical protein